MNVKETDFPEKFRPIIRRLQTAIQEEEIQNIMTVEDDVLAELNEYENRIAEAIKQKEEALRKQEEAIKLLLSLGVAKEEIAHKLGISLEALEGLEPNEWFNLLLLLAAKKKKVETEYAR